MFYLTEYVLLCRTNLRAPKKCLVIHRFYQIADIIQVDYATVEDMVLSDEKVSI